MNGSPIYPNPQSQEGILLAAFGRQESLTVGEALRQYGVYALSQRCGDLRRRGFRIESEYVKTATGKHPKRYWLAA